jgi:hypothetical protein
MSPKCSICKRTFKNGRSLKLHLSRSKKCSIGWTQELNSEISPARDPLRRPNDLLSDADQADWLQDSFPASREGSPETLGKRPRVTIEEIDDEEATGCYPDSGNAALEKRPRVTAEEVDDDEAPGRYPEPYPGNAAECLGQGQTRFHQVREEQEAQGKQPWAPFANMEEWALAKWLVRRVNQTGIDEFLKLPIVRPTFFLSTFIVLTNCR